MADDIGAQVDRRYALRVIGMALLAAACGPTASTDANGTADGDVGSDGSDTSDGNGSGTSTDTSDLEFDAGDAIPSTSPSQVPMPPELVEALVGVYAGTWLGSWADGEGASGTIDANVGFDVPNSLLEIVVAAVGPILGTDGLEPTSVSVPLGGDFHEFEERAPLGYFYVSNLGDETEHISLSDPPGAPDVEFVMLRLEYGPDGAATASYSTTFRDGREVSGTIVVQRGDVRPAIPSV